jgi:hypothetical protein
MAAPIIIVSGGVVQDVICDNDEGYWLLDWDNIGQGDKIGKELAQELVERKVYTWDEIKDYVGDEKV